MPHNNRLSGSSALKTNDMWSKTIGYDPYGDDLENKRKREEEKIANEQASNLLLLAKMSNISGTNDIRGACKKCNKVGHFSFQCRNMLDLGNNVILFTYNFLLVILIKLQRFLLF